VTCPTTRVHPAILAQATATVGNLLDGRFTWGVGTGEALNEHILGDRWPSAPVRLEQLEEAIGVVRELWRGDTVDHRGDYYCVEDAKLFDPPEHDIPIVVSAFGPEAAQLAARVGDGLWTSSPETVVAWQEAGGEGPVYSQISLCWDTDADKAAETAHRVWRNTAVPGQLSQDLPTPTHFDQATSIVTTQMVAEQAPCGPDKDEVVAKATELIAGGVDHVYFHQIGPDQEGFCEFWKAELEPALRVA
jgi:G6PDH family F420-dependent oxidoreductase